MTIIHCSCGKTYDDKYLIIHVNSTHHQKFVEYRWNKDDTMKKHKKRETEMKNQFILLFYLNRSYSDNIDTIDEVENIEQVAITDNKTTKCCYYSLEFLKFVVQYIKK